MIRLYHGNSKSDIIIKAGKHLADIKEAIDIDIKSSVNVGFGEIPAENKVPSKGQENRSDSLKEKEFISDDKVTSDYKMIQIEKILLSTVSRLTGYPEETLALDMDLEADLGIDSIKKVEIFSCLEENIPGIVSIPPEIMGSLKTLGKITEYLAGYSNNNEISKD